MTISYPDEPTLEDPAGRRRRRLRLLLGGFGVAIAASAVLALALAYDGSTGEPGPATETLYRWPAEVPRFSDVTEAWGLDDWRNTAAFAASGGVVVADIDADGRLDIVVAGGEAMLFLSSGDGFRAVEPPLAADSVSVDAADVDGDGRLDVLIGRERGPDLILWGDSLLGPRRQITELDGGDPTTGLIAGDFDGDGRIDVLRLGYGGERASPDLIWVQAAFRSFEPVELPNGRRRSLAAGVADFTGKGGLDIWVTRDVGWLTGGDSLYVRSDVEGWLDRAPAFGTAVEIDGMGVSVGDFTGDERLDVYLSDLGDNELLRRTGLFLEAGEPNYVRDADRGIGRIRGPADDAGVVSSSWASGLADLNLDGRLDLVVVNGGFPGADVDHKVPGTEIAASDPPSIFLGLPGGVSRWADVWPDLGLAWEGAGRGLALGDLDGDLDTDMVISTRDAGLRVLRNDGEEPSVAVRVAPGCDLTGLFVNAFVDDMPLQLPMAASTFSGRHAAEFIVGTNGEPVFLPSGDRSRGPARHALAGNGRQSVTLSCQEVGRTPLR